jgi:hypothetical protein
VIHPVFLQGIEMHSHTSYSSPPLPPPFQHFNSPNSKQKFKKKCRCGYGTFKILYRNLLKSLNKIKTAHPEQNKKGRYILPLLIVKRSDPAQIQTRAGIFKRSMGARNQVGIYRVIVPARQAT